MKVLSLTLFAALAASSLALPTVANARDDHHNGWDNNHHHQHCWTEWHHHHKERRCR